MVEGKSILGFCKTQYFKKNDKEYKESIKFLFDLNDRLLPVK